jgi:predicted nucleotidyltransferase
MLKIFNSLELFFEDVFVEISVREYAKLKNISPPTASKLLKDFAKEGLLIENQRGIYIYFRANRESNLFKDLASAYWRNKLYNLFQDIHDKFLYKQLILFGSIAKTENTIKSDVDIYVDLPKKKIDLNIIEKKLKRNIQIHFREQTKNVNLYKNIKKGLIII